MARGTGAGAPVFYRVIAFSSLGFTYVQFHYDLFWFIMLYDTYNYG